MAKGQDLSRYQQGIVRRYYDNLDTITLTKLSEAVSDLYVCDDAEKAAKLWTTVHGALKKTPADQMKVGQIIASRDIEKLAKLVNDLATGAIKPKSTTPGTPAGGVTASAPPVPSPVHTPSSVAAAPSTEHSLSDTATPAADPGSEVPATAPAPPAAGITEPPAVDDDTLRRALSMFKKRLKLSRLDDESRLGPRATSSGKKSQITAIQPPRDFPRAVWEALARQGTLKHTGGGFYALTEDLPKGGM